MISNRELLTCPGYDCDGCKVHHTCRRVRAEYRRRRAYDMDEKSLAEIRRLRAEKSRIGNELGVALDLAKKNILKQLMRVD